MTAHRTLLTALTLSLALSAAPAVRADLPPAGPRAWSVRQTPVVEVVRRVKESVVNIHSERTVRSMNADELLSLTPSQNRVNGMGTGIVIDPRGYIVTNHHVVEDVSLLRVRLGDGTSLAARVVARDTEHDLALLKINPPRPLPVMPLGTAKDLQVGESVVAIGNAYGYDHTVTVGVVSAVGRDVSLNKDVRYRSLIQTDAAINPGNSGGPLVNMAGELVGVNVAIRAGAQGIGFAIPVDNMIGVASTMLAQLRGRQNVAPVGLLIKDDVAETAILRRVVVDGADGAAAKAGLRRGDVVVKVGDVAVLSMLDVERGLLDREAGSKVEVVVRREGRDQPFSVVLEQAARAPSQPAATLTSTNGAAGATAQVWRQLGLQLFNVSNPAEITRAFPQLHGGLLLGEIRPDSPAAKAGLKQGDILVGLHQWEMLTMDNVLYVLNHADRASFTPLRFYILRSGTVHRGWLQIAD
ncbi:MAG: trypsin-like peptidase domain-containing protein [Gemmataceae bacterium]